MIEGSSVGASEPRCVTRGRSHLGAGTTVLPPNFAPSTDQLNSLLFFDQQQVASRFMIWLTLSFLLVHTAGLPFYLLAALVGFALVLIEVAKRELPGPEATPPPLLL